LTGDEREPLAAPAQADETYLGAPKSGKRGRGAAGKVLVAGAVGCRDDRSDGTWGHLSVQVVDLCQCWRGVF